MRSRIDTSTHLRIDAASDERRETTHQKIGKSGNQGNRRQDISTSGNQAAGDQGTSKSGSISLIIRYPDSHFLIAGYPDTRSYCAKQTVYARMEGEIAKPANLDKRNVGSTTVENVQPINLFVQNKANPGPGKLT
jgi:hypothetical protein